MRTFNNYAHCKQKKYQNKNRIFQEEAHIENSINSVRNVRSLGGDPIRDIARRQAPAPFEEPQVPLQHLSEHMNPNPAGGAESRLPQERLLQVPRGAAHEPQRHQRRPLPGNRREVRGRDETGEGTDGGDGPGEAGDGYGAAEPALEDGRPLVEEEGHDGMQGGGGGEDAIAMVAGGRVE